MINYDTILETTIIQNNTDAFVIGLHKAYEDNYNVSEATLIKGMQFNGMYLQYVREEDKSVPICLAAVKKNGDAFQYVPNSISGVAVADALTVSDPFPNDNIAIEALKTHGLALRYMSDLSDNPSICLLAANSVGDSVQFMSPTMLSGEYGKGIMESAIKNAPYAIKYIKKSYFTNIVDYYSMALSAVKIRGELLEFVDTPTAEVCLEAVRANPFAIKFVSTSISG